MAKVYLETSFVSACVTGRRDPLSRYRRTVSRLWWRHESPLHELYVSPEVIRELSDRRFPRSRAAPRHLAGVPLLDVSLEVMGLTRVLVEQRAMPGPLEGDALHVAVATVHNMDYVLSWNVLHLANPNKVVHLQTVCLRLGLVPPQVVTPDALWSVSP